MSHVLHSVAIAWVPFRSHSIDTQSSHSICQTTYHCITNLPQGTIAALQLIATRKQGQQRQFQGEMIMDKDTAYLTLGLPPFASLEQVKLQYRKIVHDSSHNQFFHSTNFAADPGLKKAAQAAHDQLLRISTAYSFLTVPDSSRHSDAYSYHTTQTPVCTPLLVGELGCFDLPAEETPKRTLDEIDTVMQHPAASPSKKIKLHQQESLPPPFIIRTSIKRDSWAVEQSAQNVDVSSTPTKRMKVSPLCT